MILKIKSDPIIPAYYWKWTEDKLKNNDNLRTAENKNVKVIHMKFKVHF